MFLVKYKGKGLILIGHPLAKLEDVLKDTILATKLY